LIKIRSYSSEWLVQQNKFLSRTETHKLLILSVVYNLQSFPKRSQTLLVNGTECTYSELITFGFIATNYRNQLQLQNVPTEFDLI